MLSSLYDLDALNRLWRRDTLKDRQEMDMRPNVSSAQEWLRWAMQRSPQAVEMMNVALFGRKKGADGKLAAVDPMRLSSREQTFLATVMELSLPFVHPNQHRVLDEIDRMERYLGHGLTTRHILQRMGLALAETTAHRHRENVSFEFDKSVVSGLAAWESILDASRGEIPKNSASN